MNNRLSKLQLHPAKTLALGFALAILLGAILLSLPFVTADGEAVPLIDAWFTATSAVCVTGLVTLTTAEVWNFWGQLIIILLIQFGGLGIMSTATIGIFLTGKRFSLSDRFALKESYDEFSYSGVIRLAKWILLLTLGIELFGAAVLALSFVPRYGWLQGIWYSIFHSISAFCNAGFDIIGAESLRPLQTLGSITFPIAGLVIIGGLGFSVLMDLIQYRKRRKLQLHTRFVLLLTIGLILGGMLFFLIAEYTNPLTLGELRFADKLENAFFQSVTPRTAGYATLNQWDLRSPSQALTMFFMFVGGSPGSTAGGIKTVTFGLLIATVISVVKGYDDTEIFQRRIARAGINKAIAIMVIAIGVLLLMVLILTALNPGLKPSLIAFETMSAFGTVGLSAGITPLFSNLSKVVLMLTMFIGRVGVLTMFFALTERVKATKQTRYPEGRIHIG